jgi:hypothetical protein
MQVPALRGLGMRTDRVFISFAVSIACGIAVQNAAFSQDYRGTWKQQMACTPDVWRLCSAQVPDVNRIVACLQRNSQQLSGACRAVIEPTVNSRGDDQPPDDRIYRPRREYEQRPYDRDYRSNNPYDYRSSPYEYRRNPYYYDE